MKVFLAGAGGAIGRRLTPLLRAAGHTVMGTTRSADKVQARAYLGDRQVNFPNDAAHKTIADRLIAAASTAGVDALNLRVHVPGVTPEAVAAQINRLGADVATPVRDALYRGGGNRTRGE